MTQQEAFEIIKNRPKPEPMSYSELQAKMMFPDFKIIEIDWRQKRLEYEAYKTLGLLFKD